MQYKIKLKDPRWIEFRKRIYKKDGYRCTICNTKDRPLNAHHRFYENNKQPWDYNIGDLDTLCNWCHEFLHNPSKFDNSNTFNWDDENQLCRNGKSIKECNCC